MIVQKRMIDNGNERLDLWYRITYLGLATNSQKKKTKSMLLIYEVRVNFPF